MPDTNATDIGSAGAIPADGPVAVACSECGEPAIHQPPAGPWAEVWHGAHGRVLPEWSHTDGEPLCPVIGPDGYEPAQPVTAAARCTDDDADEA